MVPWLLNRQGIDVQQAADDLGVSVAQLEADLNLLFLCGYGQMPDELIEADWEGGKVFVGNADTIARPLRLGVDEAVTLMVGLRSLREVPGIAARDAVDRALAKLEDAAGSAAAPPSRVRAELADGASAELLARARQAIADHRRVHLRYLVPARDESTERDVDPMRVVGLDGRWYLEGWCHRAEDTRMFRMDRVEELTVLDVDGTPPAQARERDLSEGTFRPARPTSSSRCACSRGDVGRRLLPVESAGRAGGRTVACSCACCGGHRLAAPAGVADGRQRRGPRPARGRRRGRHRPQAALTAYPATAGGDPCCRGGAGCSCGSAARRRRGVPRRPASDVDQRHGPRSRGGPRRAMVEAVGARVDQLATSTRPTAVTQPPHRLREEYRGSGPDRPLPGA